MSRIAPNGKTAPLSPEGRRYAAALSVVLDRDRPLAERSAADRELMAVIDGIKSRRVAGRGRGIKRTRRDSFLNATVPDAIELRAHGA